MRQGPVRSWGLAAIAGLLTVQVVSVPVAASGAEPAASADQAVVATVKVGSRPADMELDSSTGRLYVLDVDSYTVAVVDTTTNTVTDTRPVPAGAFDLVLDAPRGLIYVVSGFHSDGPGVVTIVEMAGWSTVATVTLGGEAASPVLDARRGLLYVPVADADTSAGAVAVVDVVQGRVRATVRVGKAPWAVALDNSGKRLYVSSQSPARVFVIDTMASRVVAKINVRTSPQYLLVDSARSRAYAVQSAGINVIDTRRNRVVATVRQAVSVEGAPPVLDAAARLIYAVDDDANAVAVISTRSNRVTSRIPLVDYGESAILDKAAARLYVSNFDEGVGRTLSVVDTTKRALLGTIAVGKGPQIPVLDASASRLYVPNWVSGTVSVVDTQQVP